MRTFGADPEVFLQNTRHDPVSAIGYIGGTKKRPLKVQGGALQEDNVTAEFNIDPASTENEFVANIQRVMGQLREKVAPLGYELLITPTADFSQEYLAATPAAMESGCEASFDALTGGGVIEPPDMYTITRHAGGHVHIGDPALVDPYAALNAVAKLALFVLPAMYKWDKGEDMQRLYAYGCPGAYRPKKYGIEWRAPSNRWLVSEARMRWMYRNINRALDMDVDLTKDFSNIASAMHSTANGYSHGIPCLQAKYGWAEEEYPV